MDPEAVAAIAAALMVLRSQAGVDEPDESQWDRRHRPDRPWSASSASWSMRRNRLGAE
jgi:hypothetical protein